MTRHISMMRGGAVEKEKTSHARGPGCDSRPGIFFLLFWAVCFASFLSFQLLFLSLLTGLNLF